MAALQKFKPLATQCGVTQGPRSPRTYPVVNFRIPKTTLRVLLIRVSRRKSSSSREMSHAKSIVGSLPEKKKGDKDLSGRTLRDLFVSSSSLLEKDDDDDKVAKEKLGAKSAVVLMSHFNSVTGLGGEPPGSARQGWFGFRRKMLLRVWRPTLMAIPE